LSDSEPDERDRDEESDKDADSEAEDEDEDDDEEEEEEDDDDDDDWLSSSPPSPTFPLDFLRRFLVLGSGGRGAIGSLEAIFMGSLIKGLYLNHFNAEE
jgi:hypothetical protein